MSFLKRPQLQSLLQVFLFLSCLLPVFADDGETPPSVPEIPLASRIILALFLIPIGLAYCFAGFRYKKFLVLFAGLYLGGMLAFVIARSCINLEESSHFMNIILAMWVSSCALIGGVVTLSCYKIGIIILGGFLGFVFAGAFIATGTPSSNMGQLTLTIIFVIIGGVLAMMYSDILVVVSTAFSGSSMFLQGIDLFANTGFKNFAFSFSIHKELSDAKGPLWAMLVTFIIMGSLGVLIQLKWKKSQNYVEIR